MNPLRITLCIFIGIGIGSTVTALRYQAQLRRREADGGALTYVATRVHSFFTAKNDLQFIETIRASLKSGNINNALFVLDSREVEKKQEVTRLQVELEQYPSVLSEMRKQIRQSQALVPTPASVTPAAGAPVAPDASAAHL